VTVGLLKKSKGAQFLSFRLERSEMEESLNHPILKGFLDSSFGLARNDNAVFFLKERFSTAPLSPISPNFRNFPFNQKGG
jgi:hypothetical protein